MHSAWCNMWLKRKASEEAIKQYERDKAALQLMRAELYDMRGKYAPQLTVSNEISSVIRRVNSALKSINFLIGE